MALLKQFKNKRPLFRRKKELIAIIICCSLFISTIYLYTYVLNTPIHLTKYPKIMIKCNEKIERDDYVECEIELISENPDESIRPIKSKIKIQGMVNARLPKKGYRLELSEQKSLLGMREDDDWTLFAMYLDYPRTRIKLSFDLWRSLESTNPTAILPESKYVCVYLNDQFKGLYLLSEKNDRRLYQLDDAQNNLDSSLIFQAKSYEIFREYNPGGWQQDWPNEYEGIYIMDEILTDLTYFINNTPDDVFFNPTTGIYSKFDRLNLIDFFLFNYFQDHIDFWSNNFYIVRNTHPSKFILIPWDFDGCFGQKEYKEYNPDSNPETLIREVNQLYNRLLDDISFRQACKERWIQLREDQLKERTILDKLSKLLEEIEDILEFEMKLWEPEDHEEETGEKFIYEKYIEKLYDWIPQRLDFCDNYFMEF